MLIEVIKTINIDVIPIANSLFKNLLKKYKSEGAKTPLNVYYKNNIEFYQNFVYKIVMQKLSKKGTIDIGTHAQIFEEVEQILFIKIDERDTDNA